MPGQVPSQELQVPGTQAPEGGTLARVLARTLPFRVAGQYFSTPKK